MVGCFPFLKPRTRTSVSRSDCSCRGPLSPSSSSLQTSNAANDSKSQDEKKQHPLSGSPYYDACNPPPFAPFGAPQQKCCGGIHTGDAAAHSHSNLPSYHDAQQAGSSADEQLSQAMSDVAKTLELEIAALDKELRDLSLKMHSHPEIQYQEYKTHDLFVEYFKTKKEWKLTPKAYGLDTAWEAVFSHKAGKDTRTIGFQSELDALPGIGHACGHNLIAISGVAAALSVAAVLVKKDIPGTVVLLGTPAEEGGGGKILLQDKGAYKGMDACLMVHPAPGSATGAMLAVQPVVVTYKGQTAHAGAAPWEGVNALDAAVLAYNNISALRQQIRPQERVHGIIQGKDWAPNVVPGESTLIYNVRSPTISGLKALVERVQKCFEAAALATGCKGDYDWQTAYADVHNTRVLADAYAGFLSQRFNLDVPNLDFAASTDFGNITYALPSLHAEYAIHLDDPKTQGNHTIGFTNAAATQEAHDRTKEAALGIAVVGARILLEKEFRDKVWAEWSHWRESADGP
ncbi:amidohydrolase [Testicularia cyperi]|uniref:Amidohydrolase n=1 Tax=Testicularia cyperi TaxID=1882483 RepID=A0A317XL80_9BASI|nr:amidohydrolase [Testicularia cyperi]